MVVELAECRELGGRRYWEVSRAVSKLHIALKCPGTLPGWSRRDSLYLPPLTLMRPCAIVFSGRLNMVVVVDFHGVHGLCDRNRLSDVHGVVLWEHTFFAISFCIASGCVRLRKLLVAIVWSDFDCD